MSDDAVTRNIAKMVLAGGDMVMACIIAAAIVAIWAFVATLIADVVVVPLAFSLVWSTNEACSRRFRR
jgi:hypothetical protein